MALPLQLLQEQPEAVEAGLPHAEHRVAALGLPKIRGAAAAGGVQDVQLAVHVPDHEIFPLRGKKEMEPAPRAGGRGGPGAAMPTCTR